MKKKSNLKKIIISLTAVLLVGVIIAVSLLTGDVQVKNNNYGSGKVAVNVDDSFNISIGDNSQTLLFSKEKGAVAFSYGNQAVFNSCSQAAANNALAKVIDVRIRDKNGNIYSMDSSHNCAPFNAIDVKKEGNVLDVVFTLFADSKQHSKGVENASVYAVVPVKFSFENSKFNVSINTKNVKLPEDMFIEKLSVLPGLYSSAQGENGFYTIPDGCGAQIDLNEQYNAPLSLKMGVYGNDTSFYDYSQGAILPYFAYTQNGVVMNAVIEDGDALSEISVKRNAQGGGYLYNTFTVTPCVMEDESLKTGETYNGVLSQSYYLSDAENNYNEIAAQVRDNLVQRGYLSPNLNGIYNDFPFFIQVIGSPDGREKLTTFEDAAEITAFLKSRGVRNISLRLSGFGKKGLNSTSGMNGSFSRALGGKQGYESLATAIEEQGNTLWLDMNILSDSVSGNEKGFKIYDDESKFAGLNSKDFSALNFEKVSENISESYSLASELPNTDICINDASKILYSDRQKDINRQEVSEKLKDKSSSLGAVGSVMLSSPSVYLMRETDSVFSLPDTSALEGTQGVKSLPVLQLVLHGSVVYGSSPLNVTNLSNEDALLRCIEFGSVPSFLFTYKGDGALDYSSFSSQTAEYYAKAKKLLPVMDMKITSHEMITENVYKITYDYSKIIYVNYNPSAVKVDGIMISAKDFVVI